MGNWTFGSGRQSEEEVEHIWVEFCDEMLKISRLHRNAELNFGKGCTGRIQCNVAFGC
jgi:hypothetical protein